MREENIYPFPNYRWSLGKDALFHPTVYMVCDSLSMPGFKLNHVNKSWPWRYQLSCSSSVYGARSLHYCQGLLRINDERYLYVTARQSSVLCLSRRQVLSCQNNYFVILICFGESNQTYRLSSHASRLNGSYHKNLRNIKPWDCWWEFRNCHKMYMWLYSKKLSHPSKVARCVAIANNLEASIFSSDE